MIIVKNNTIVKVITLGFAQGITLYPFIFVRKTANYQTLNHERIHIKQQKETLIIGFFLLYLIEWLFKGYKGISFEREAYKYDLNPNYYSSREHYSFLKFIRHA